MTQILQVHPGERSGEKTQVHARADALLMATINESLQAFQFVVIDGEKHFVDNVILKDAVGIG